jgi:hypothetical protein
MAGNPIWSRAKSPGTLRKSDDTPPTGQRASLGSANMKRTVESTLIHTEMNTQPALAGGEKSLAKEVRNDPMRRFVPTPYTAFLPVMGSVVRFETNHSKLLDLMVELFARYAGAAGGSPKFLWRIVVDPQVHFGTPWPRRSSFSEGGLRFAHFGQRNCLAVNIDAREAIAFVAEGLVDDVLGFTSPFVDTLFYMTAGSLGLVPFAAACVSSGMKGLLVLGSPNQGKTTATYLAAQGGLTFHADQSVFLDTANGELRAWGDFVPIAFRPESLQFFPELETRTRLFSYCDFTFCYMDKEKLDSTLPGFVTPICCVVLERGAASSPRLVRLATEDCSRSLSQYIAFKDDDRFEDQRLKILSALARLPVYHLAYDSDPATAAPFLQQLLTRHDVPGPRRSDGS